MSSYEAVRDFQDDLGGWDDETCLVLVCEFLDDHGLTHKFKQLLDEVRKDQEDYPDPVSG